MPLVTRNPTCPCRHLVTFLQSFHFRHESGAVRRGPGIDQSYIYALDTYKLSAVIRAPESPRTRAQSWRLLRLPNFYSVARSSTTCQPTATRRQSTAAGVVDKRIGRFTAPNRCFLYEYA